MAQPARTKVVVADPSGSNRFCVGGGNEIRLYEWEHTRSHSRFNHLGGTSELGQLRSFAWSPHTAFPDLVAAGLHAGRILLLRLDSSPPANRTAGNLPSAVQINIRHSRPCNVVAFSQAEPGLLAVGLEKGRGESLLIYDVEQAARSIDSGKDNTGTPSTKPFILQRDGGASHTHSPSGNLEPSPLLSFGSSESVTAAAFLSSPVSSSSSPLLAAAMAGKWLRTYDLRSPPSTVATWGTRAVQSIAANPFNSQQFASSGEDGIVRLWDLRRPMDALVSFSEVDAGAVSARHRPTVIAKPLIEIKWSQTRKGILTTLERDGHSLRVWQIEDGPSAKLEGAMEGAIGGGDHNVYEGHAQTAMASDGLRMPVVLGDRRPRSFQQPLTSFAIINSPMDSTATHFLGVSRDTSSPGTSGHRLEVIHLPSARHASFLDRGLLVSSEAAPSGFSTFHIEPPPPELPFAAGAEGESPEGLKKHRTLLARGRTLSLNVASLPQFDRNLTPRPSGSVTPRRLSRTGEATSGPAEEDMLSRSGLAALSTDVSVTLRQNVERGYGSDPIVNASLFESPISEFWSWIARAEALAKDACVSDYDFRYRGVIPILVGFQSCSSSNSTASSNSAQHSSVKTTSRTIYSDITRSLRKGDEAQTKNAAYSAAASALVHRRKTDGTFAISSSAFSAQRKLALQSCGQDWEEDYEVVCARFIKNEDYDAAARHAFFSGHLEKAMSYLKSCKEENVRMLAPILAAYMAQNDLKGTDSSFAQTCRSLSSDGDTPWIRAMFAFLASGDWRELVDESGLPLKDRVAVALRFLSDSELLPFLQDLGNEAISTGDPEAVVLFGLRGDGLKLLSNFLDRTADVQTVALAVSFVSPGIVRSDRRVQRWVQTYRDSLDGLQLYSARAIFDSARGRRARAAMEQARMSGRHAEAQEVDKALKKAAPPQMVVRCQFCSTNIAPASQPLPMHGGDRGGVGALGIKSTLCPNCSKSLPSCAICLTKPSIHSFASDGSSNLCWCQKCRHGGHTVHVLEWFERSQVCAVADCDCRCRDEY